MGALQGSLEGCATRKPETGADPASSYGLRRDESGFALRFAETGRCDTRERGRERERGWEREREGGS